MTDFAVAAISANLPGAGGINPISALEVPTLPQVGATEAASSPGFSNMVTDSLTQLQRLQANTDLKAVQAATGELKDAHEYTIALTQSQVAGELLASVRNRAVEAFNEIMRMPV